MTKYEILVATDDSEYARKAEKAAMKIARSYNIRMVAIYIAVGRKDSEREERTAKGENVLNRVIEEGEKMGLEVNKLLVGVSMQRMPQKGAMADTIARAILDAAEKYKVHTIVLGGKGESEINPELGSVALAVVKKAKCTVMVAR
ncbi:MAG: universal stress protein [Euryarchaeota archaeon]|nr:universal stress protein [Euryarchaeota archaeon]MBU4075641.1 universal stress protein [Euryarchaeota archaeon]MBU4138861.1 universal stress protein [Euryarchaeota archaeon]